MTKPKYASPEERRAALSEAARRQMLAQWEAKRAVEGTELGYFGGHMRVRKARGPAKEHMCRCGKPAQHWALRHGADHGDPQNYDPMCVPCHFAYDEVGIKNKLPTHAERSAAARLAWSRRPKDERAAIAQRGVATRTANGRQSARDPSTGRFLPSSGAVVAADCRSPVAGNG